MPGVRGGWEGDQSLFGRGNGTSAVEDDGEGPSAAVLSTLAIVLTAIALAVGLILAGGLCACGSAPKPAPAPRGALRRTQSSRGSLGSAADLKKSFKVADTADAPQKRKRGRRAESLKPAGKRVSNPLDAARKQSAVGEAAAKLRQPDSHLSPESDSKQPEGPARSKAVANPIAARSAEDGGVAPLRAAAASRPTGAHPDGTENLEQAGDRTEPADSRAPSRTTPASNSVSRAGSSHEGQETAASKHTPRASSTAAPKAPKLKPMKTPRSSNAAAAAWKTGGNARAGEPTASATPKQLSPEERIKLAVSLGVRVYRREEDEEDEWFVEVQSGESEWTLPGGAVLEHLLEGAEDPEDLLRRVQAGESGVGGGEGDQGEEAETEEDVNGSDGGSERGETKSEEEADETESGGESDEEEEGGEEEHGMDEDELPPEQQELLDELVEQARTLGVDVVRRDSDEEDEWFCSLVSGNTEWERPEGSVLQEELDLSDREACMRLLGAAQEV